MNLVQRAQTRALIDNFLMSHQGSHSVSEVASVLGINTKSTGQIMAKMYRNGLLPEPYKEKGEWWYIHQYWINKSKSEGAAKVDVPPKRPRPLDGDDVMAILGAVAIFKRGYISDAILIATIEAILKGK